MLLAWSFVSSAVGFARRKQLAAAVTAWFTRVDADEQQQQAHGLAQPNRQLVVEVGRIHIL